MPYGCAGAANFFGTTGVVKLNCQGAPNNGKTPFDVKVTYSVTQTTRTKYKLPSKTVATLTLTGKATASEFIKPSKAMQAALKKIKSGAKLTVKVKAVYTTPVTETVTDSLVIKSFGYGLKGGTDSPYGGANLDTQNAPTVRH